MSIKQLVVLKKKKEHPSKLLLVKVFYKYKNFNTLVISIYILTQALYALSIDHELTLQNEQNMSSFQDNHELNLQPFCRIYFLRFNN